MDMDILIKLELFTTSKCIDRFKSNGTAKTIAKAEKFHS